MHASRSLRTPRAPCPWFQLDRGGDCWQVLQYAEKGDGYLTVRATHDRKVDAEFDKLWATVESTKKLCTRRIDVAKKPATTRRYRNGGRRQVKVPVPAQRARTAKVELRACAISLIVPSPDGKHHITVNAILVREKDTRPAHRLEWMLLTTHPIKTDADVLAVVSAYALRWRVEDFHRAWKRGVCRVEDTQLRSREALYKWATLLAAVATRAMKLAERAKSAPDLPASSEFSKTELEAIYALRRPRNAEGGEPSLALAVRWVAEIGGHTGPWNGRPGPTTIGRGLHDVLVTARAFEYRDRKR